MKKARYLVYSLALFVIGSTFLSCETEVDLFTDGESVPVVFALLEPQNDIQYFRINPTFQGTGDARETAGDPALTNYKEGEIEAKLIQYTTDGQVIEHMLKDSVGIRELDNDGIFNPDNRIYYLETPVTYLSNGNLDNAVLKAGHRYKLEITNTNTGKVASSEITLGDINAIRPIDPKEGKPVISLYWINLFSGTEYNKNYSFDFDAGPNSERFLLELTYYYTDRPAQDTSTRRDSSVSFDIGEVNGIEASDGLKRISIDFDGEKFYSILSTKLPESIKRSGTVVDLSLTAVGVDLDLYLSVQGASLTSLAQELPSYSNIENGLGVFSFRLVSTHKNFYLNEATAKNVIRSTYTRDRFACSHHGSQGFSEGTITCDK